MNDYINTIRSVSEIENRYLANAVEMLFSFCCHIIVLSIGQDCFWTQCFSIASRQKLNAQWRRLCKKAKAMNYASPMRLVGFTALGYFLDTQDIASNANVGNFGFIHLARFGNPRVSRKDKKMIDPKPTPDLNADCDGLRKSRQTGIRSSVQK